uniref:Uncharacterized protein n=1 Tax=Avena sativa TaxID=4498 RepID=A0ACD5V051_AVESA
MAKLEVLSREVVVPANGRPGSSIWFSNLDLAARRGYTPTVYFFQHSGDHSDFFSTDSMKESLARALCAFYPLAGRLGLDDGGRVQVDCTGEGVLFVTARSKHYSLEELMEEFVPCEEMRELLVPPTPAPNPPCALLFVQVTRLRCGGVVLGQAMHHSVADARSAALFFNTWASISRGDGMPLVPPPCFDHTLLAARPVHARKVVYDHLEYKPDKEEPAVEDDSAATSYASAIIRITGAQVDALKAKCGGGSSTFRSVVALAWQCVCRARSLPPSAETRLYSMVDMRARLDPPLPPGYFGNAVIRTSVSAMAGEVMWSPVFHVARLFQAATSHGDQYTRSLVDYLEGVGTTNLPRSGISRTHLRAISWMGMSFSDADFGWGTPVFMGPALMYYSGFLYVMNTPPGKDDGALALVLSLEPETMPEFTKLFAQELAKM